MGVGVCTNIISAFIKLAVLLFSFATYLFVLLKSHSKILMDALH